MPKPCSRPHTKPQKETGYSPSLSIGRDYSHIYCGQPPKIRELERRWPSQTVHHGLAGKTCRRGVSPRLPVAMHLLPQPRPAGCKKYRRNNLARGALFPRAATWITGWRRVLRRRAVAVPNTPKGDARHGRTRLRDRTAYRRRLAN